jgi:spermidine/putrescine transport system permease protein
VSAAAKDRARRTRRNWLLSLPALLILTFAAAGPLLIVAVYSFKVKGDFSGVGEGWTTNAWFEIFRQRDIFDPAVTTWADAHLTIFWRSVKLSILTTVLTFMVGFPTAWFIATRSLRARTLWLFLITIPFWTNLLIRTFAINEIIRNEGLLNLILLKIGLISEPLQIIYTDTAIMIGMVYVYLPLMVLPLYAAIERFDLRLLEAAHDLYASRWQVLRRVIFPLTRPGIVAGSILVFVPSLGAYVTPRILGGGKNMMIGNFIDLQFGQGRNWPLGAALSMLLLIIVTVALLFYVRAATKGSAR